MNERERTRTSKFLSLVLRHQPETIGIDLDDAGWVEVSLLLARCHEHGMAITEHALAEIVATSPKRRFALSEDGLRIRANQGHSVDVELGYEASDPPALLFHGTVAKVLPAIHKDGLLKMQRHHVHLSPERETAAQVGKRRGKPVILVVRSGAMLSAGHEFFVSANGVWLTEHVPAGYITFPD